MPKALWIVLLPLACLFLVSPSVKADQITPGGAGAPDAFVLGYAGCPGATGSLPCGPARAIVASNLPGAATWSGAGLLPFNGSVYEQVESDPTNVFCPGCLDFLFQVQNSSSSAQSITRIEETGFSPYLVDVGYDSVSLGSAILCGIDDNGFCNDGNPATVPATVDRSADGNVVGFSFPGVAPGENTVDIVIDTNATSFTGPLATIEGSLGATATVDIWGPSGTPVGSGTAVPEPSTALLLATGLFSLLGLLKKVNA